MTTTLPAPASSADIATITLTKAEGAGTGAPNVTRSWDEAGLVLGFLAASAPAPKAYDKVDVVIVWADGHKLTHVFDLKREHAAAPVTMLLDDVRRTARLRVGEIAPAGHTADDWTRQMRAHLGARAYSDTVLRWRAVLARLPVEDAPPAVEVAPVPAVEPELAGPVAVEPPPPVEGGPAPVPAPAAMVTEDDEDDEDDVWGAGPARSVPVSAAAVAKARPRVTLSAALAASNAKHGAGLTEADAVPAHLQTARSPAHSPPTPPAGPKVYDPKDAVVPYRKGRLTGTFTMYAKPDGDCRVEFEGDHCGRRHLGSMAFEDRGASERRSARYIRTPGLADPTTAARDAIANTAKELATEWCAAHPEAFVAARLEEAKGHVSAAAEDIADLEKQLVEAREKLVAAEARLEQLTR